MVDHSANRQIAKNTAFLYFRMAFVMLVTLYTVRVVLNALGEIDYGINNVICGFVAMFGVLNATLSNTISRYYNFEIGKRGRKGATKVYNTSLVIQAILAVLIILIIEIVGAWYIDNKMVMPNERMFVAKCIFQFAVASLLLLVMQTPYSAAVVAFEKMDYLAIVGILDACAKLFIALMLEFVNADKLMLYGVLMFGISVMDFLSYFIYCKVKFKELRIEKNFEKDLVKPMLSFSGWMLLDPISYAVKGQGCNMALNYYYGPTMNTAYGISNQVALALESFSGNISTAFRPQIIQSYSSGNLERTKNLMFSMSKIIFVLKLMLCVPIVLEADLLLHLWLGNDFPKMTIVFSQLMVIVGVVNSFAHPITVVISAIGRLKRYMIISSFIVSSVLPLSIILMMFGINPVCVCWTMVFSAVINLSACILILAREFEIIKASEYLKHVLWPCICHTFAMVLLPLFVWLIMPASFVRIVCICVASIVATLFCSYYLVLNDGEKEMLINMLKSITSGLLKKK